MNDTFTTVEGRTVTVVRVPWYRIAKIQAQVETEFREAGRPLDVPTYEAKAFTGEIEIHKHDAESVSTDEEKQAWAEHATAVEELENEKLSRRNKYILRNGIVVSETDLEAWVEEQRAQGYEPSEDDETRRWEYISDLLKTPEDTMMTIMRITSMSLNPGISEESIRAAEAMFRRAIQGDTAGGPAAGEERLDDGDTNGRGADSESMEQAAERVRQPA